MFFWVSSNIVLVFQSRAQRDSGDGNGENKITLHKTHSQRDILRVQWDKMGHDFGNHTVAR